MTKPAQHPEERSDEVFVINAVKHEFESIVWKTKRRGHTAYDERGEIVEGQFPVFARRSEIEEHEPKVLEMMLAGNEAHFAALRRADAAE